MDWCVRDVYLSWDPEWNSNSHSKIHPPKHMAALWVLLLGLPHNPGGHNEESQNSLALQVNHFINRPLACHMIWKWIFWAPSMNSLELLSFLAEGLFFLSHHSAVKWTRQVPVPYMFIGISSKELLHGATFVVHSTVALATVGMMPPEVVTYCCPFYFYL